MNNNTFLEIAQTIGNRLCDETFWYESKCNWIAHSLHEGISNPRPTISIESLSPEIYNGTSGIAFFLANLYSLSNKDEYFRTAMGSINHAIENIQQINSYYNYGYYAGQLGVLTTALRLGYLFKEYALFDRSISLLRKFLRRKITNHLFDIIYGNASAIPCLIMIYDEFDEKDALSLAIQLGDELVSLAIKEKKGYSWDSGINGIKSIHNLTGFAHGAAGIGYGLLQLFTISHTKKYLVTALKAFEYENSWFNKEHNNWPDFRVNSYDKSSSFISAVAWCHGAPGIGISRLYAYKILGRSKFLDDFKRASKTSAKFYRENIQDYNSINHSLCHGLTGIGDIMLYAKQIFGDDPYSNIASEIGVSLIDRHKKTNKWRCGIPVGETPGLMLGLAGIGNFYLRLYDMKVPSPLVIGRI